MFSLLDAERAAAQVSSEKICSQVVCCNPIRIAKVLQVLLTYAASAGTQT